MRFLRAAGGVPRHRVPEPDRPAGAAVGGGLLALSVAVAAAAVSCSPSGSELGGEPAEVPPRRVGDGVFDPRFGGVEERYRGDGPKVALLGDSISVAAAPHLRRDLRGYATKIAAVIGEGVAGGPISHAFGSGDMLEIATRYGQDPPAVGIVALGTNDVWRAELSAADARRVLPDLVSALGAGCLVVVLLADGAGVADYDPAAAAAINDQLRTVADEVVDWGEIAARPGSLKADGIHPTDVGAAALAEALAAAVRRCEP